MPFEREKLGEISKLPGEKIKEKEIKEKEIKKEEFPRRERTNYGEEVIEPLKIKKGETFVDVGSGVGLATIMAAEKKAEALGIELDRETLKLSNKIAKIIELTPNYPELAKNIAELMETEVELGKKRAKGTAKLMETRTEREIDQEFFEKEEKVKQLKKGNFEEKRLKHFLLNWLVGKSIFHRFYLRLKEKISNLDEILDESPLPENVNFLQGTASNLPLKNNSADKILCADVIHWIPKAENREEALKEILRIAKNGSLIYIFSDPFRRKKKILGKGELTSAQEEILRVSKKEGITLEEIKIDKSVKHVAGKNFLYKVIKTGKEL